MPSAGERRQPAAAARAGRQLHDLPLALPDDAVDGARCSTCCCSTRPTRAARVPAARAGRSFRRVAERGPAPQPGAAPDPEAAHRRCAWPRSATLRRRWCRPVCAAWRHCCAELTDGPARAVRRDRPQLFRACGDAGRHAGHAAAGRAVIYEVSHRTVYDYSRAGLDLASSAASARRATRRLQTCRDSAVEIPRADGAGAGGRLFRQPHDLRDDPAVPCRAGRCTRSAVIEVADRAVPEPAATPPWEAVRDRAERSLGRRRWTRWNSPSPRPTSRSPPSCAPMPRARSGRGGRCWRRRAS